MAAASPPFTTASNSLSRFTGGASTTVPAALFGSCTTDAGVHATTGAALVTANAMAILTMLTTRMGSLLRGDAINDS
ncbi:MAG: hypothetical protein V4617_04540 [Gemmatimonadota bacterium]